MEKLEYLPNGQWQLSKAEANPYSFKHVEHLPEHNAHRYELFHDGKSYGEAAVDADSGKVAGFWMNPEGGPETPFTNDKIWRHNLEPRLAEHAVGMKSKLQKK